MDYAALKTEIMGDPLGRNYAGMLDAQVAASLNAVDRPRNRVVMTSSEVAANIDSTEWAGLTDVKRREVLGLLGIDNLDPFGFAQRVIVSAFGGGSATVAALAAARVETISRATEISLGVVNEQHIREVRTM